MMKKCLFFFLVVFIVSINKSNAQVDSTKPLEIFTDSIVVIKDSRLDVLNQKQTVINKRSKIMTSTGFYKGYRLQVLNTNDRAKAFKMKYDLLTAFPGEKAYISFQAPYFKVRFGNFLNRGDAEKMRKQLTKMFPSGVFIVDDTIEYTPKNDDDVK